MDNPTDHLAAVRAAPVTNQNDHLTAVRAALDPHNLTPPGPTCPCDHCDYSRRRNASAMWWIARGLRWLAGFDRGGN